MFQVIEVKFQQNTIIKFDRTINTATIIEKSINIHSFKIFISIHQTIK